jgi:nucleotide-binding universal stress UspA family protein
MEIKRILFATDFSEGSASAMPYAVSMARQYGAKLYFVHVIHDIAKSSGSYVPHISLDELYSEMEDHAKVELEKSVGEELRGKDVEHIVLKGTPYEEISSFAKENKIDLVVVGTYGRKGLDRMLFGSTAEQIVRHAPCPVLTVRVPNHGR